MKRQLGHSSRHLRDEFDFGLPSLWTRSHLASIAGDVSSEFIEEYIDAQAGESSRNGPSQPRKFVSS